MPPSLHTFQRKPPPPATKQYKIVKGDSGASTHFFRKEDKDCLQDLRPNTSSPSVTLPDKTTLTPTHTGTLKISPHLSTRAQTATVLPGLKSSSLISMGQLCDDNCNVLLTKTNMYAIKKDDLVLRGVRNPRDGLWDIPIPTTINNSPQPKLPPAHPALYQLSLRKTVLPSRSGYNNKKLTQHVTNVPINSLPTHLQNMEALVDYNECCYHVNKQLQADCKQPSLNVIL